MSLKGVRIEYHIIQSFPVTCLNRDEDGTPKTAIIGGQTRARISSQCWKRQVRLAMHDMGVKLGSRTKRVAELLATECLSLSATTDQAEACGKKIAKLFSKKEVLLFLGEIEIKALAEYAATFGFDEEKINEKDFQKKIKELYPQNGKKALDFNIEALDIALFGRMVAKLTEMNVEAAASFSHAISTHKISNEIDYFTALDDVNFSGAHVGINEFNSATYYRYISLDLGELEKKGLDEGNIKKAIDVFTKAIFIAVPSARQNTFSGASPWEFARVMVRKGQRLQVPFETAVKASEGGYTESSIKALVDYLDGKEKLYGSLFGKISSFDWGRDPGFSIDDLVESLKKVIDEGIVR